MKVGVDTRLKGITFRGGTWGVHLFQGTGANALIEDCIFESCTNSSGGALDIRRAHADIRNCRFVGNSAQNSGGAINTSRGTLTLTNCDFVGNSAQGEGGAKVGGAFALRL